MQDALAAVIGVGGIVAIIAVSVIIVRFASAFAKRLEARPPAVASPDPAIGELREELDAIQERLDFLERALVAQKDLGARALPAQSERADPTDRTSS